MANKKINELVTRTPSLSDLILVGDPSSGYSYKATVTALATIIETDIADGFVTLSTTQTISGAKTFTNAVLISANSPELNINQGLFSASYINFKENSSLINRILSSGAALTFITNNSGTPALVLSSAQTATFGSIPNATIDTDKFLVSDGGVLKYRTGAEVLSDIGAASSSNISGTTNYIAKFTSSSAIGNSVIYESGGNIGIATTTLTARLTVNGNAVLSGSINATETYLSSPNGLVFQINSTNANGGYAEFQTSSTTIGRIGTATQVVGSGGASVFAISSVGANDFILGTNGTQRVRIDTSGNVTFSQIANATVDTDKFLVSDSGVLKYRTGAEVLSDIGGASSASISGTTNYIPKFTSSSAIGNSVIYESSSNIGISTTDPQTILNDFSSSARGLAISNAYPFIGLNDTDGGKFYFGTQANIGYIWNAGTDAIVFATNNSEQMRLTSTGLGIGTSSPAYKLDVSGTGRFIVSSTSQNQLRVYSSDGTATLKSYSTSDGDGLILNQYYAVAGNPYLRSADFVASMGDVSSTQMRFFTKAYNSNPAVALTIASTGAATFSSNVTIQGNDLDLNNGTVLHRITNDNTNLLIRADYGNASANSTIQFSIDGTERMRLNSSGNLGLAVTPSAWGTTGVVAKALQVNNISLASTDNNGMQLSSNAYWDGSSWIYIASSVAATNYFQSAGIHAWRYAASGTAGNAISFTQAMTLTAAGNLVVGGTTAGTSLNTSLTVNNSSAGNYSGLIPMTANVQRGYYGGTSTGLEIGVSGSGYFTAWTGGSERMRITSAGSVGIGTTSPTSYYSTKLVVNVGDEDGITIAGVNDNYLMFADGTTGDDRFRGFVQYSHTTDYMAFATNASERMRITSGGNVGIGTSSPSGKLHLSSTGDTYLVMTGGLTPLTYSWLVDATSLRLFTGVGDTERMRITSGGNVLVGTSTDRGYVLLANSNSSTGAMEIRQNNAAANIPLTITNEATSGTRQMISFQSGGYGVVGSITSDNTSTAYNTSSDYRLKQDLKNFNGLNLVDSIKVYDYQWKADSTRSYGVMAHELQSVLPYAVTGVKDGEKMQGVDYSKIVPILIKSIQELKAEIETLKNK